MGVLGAIVVKDLKEILSSRYFLASLFGSLAVLLALGALMGAAAEEAAPRIKFAVVGKAATTEGELFIKYLQMLGGDIYEVYTPDLLERYSYVVFVPSNFTFPASVDVVYKFRGLVTLASLPAVEHAARLAARDMGLPPWLVAQNIYVQLGPTRLSVGEISSIYSLYFMTWLFTFIVPLLVASTAAVAVGVEKEKRTFELILATPATPASVVVGKLLSSLILAVIQLAALIFGFLFFISRLAAAAPPTSGVASAGEPLTPIFLSPAAVFMPILSVVALSIFSLTVAFLIAVKTEDIKTAQSVVPTLLIPLLLPTLMMTFLYSEAFEWYPYVHPLAVAFAVLTGSWEKAATYVAIDWALAAAGIVAVLKFATSEYLLSGRRRL